ncbi:unnamed protein product [Eruca vesicaria subsp. sativa]|uniref:Uncharacterized protein n=1 Tax=Eruca vesicaria subsp. sativa TaxID=29727 RepID=A0ABC8KMI8_ERUVS|nr:unnamed protein product [Eruca vesicaria subsp. sativa]
MAFQNSANSSELATMVNFATATNFMTSLPGYPCKIIDQFPRGSSNLDHAFAAASLYYNYPGSGKCFELEHPT